MKSISTLHQIILATLQISKKVVEQRAKTRLPKFPKRKEKSRLVLKSLRFCASDRPLHRVKQDF